MKNENDKYINNTSITLFKFSLLLILATSVARLSLSLYLPALLQIGNELKLSDAILGQTLTVFFTAFAISTLFMGPLVDSFGRKNVILSGSVIFMLGSLICGNSFSGQWLIIGRILQAIGTSSLPVAARAMIRDLCNDKQVISVLGWMALLGGIIPIVAPVLGGFITKILGWRWTFWFLVIFSAVTFIIIILKLPRSIPKNELQPFKIKQIFKNYFFILSSPKFFIVIAPLALAFGIQGAYLVTSPFIFMKHFEMSPVEFGFMNIFVVSSLFAGKYIASFVIKKKNIFVAYLIGAVLTMVGGLTFNLFIFFKIDNLFTVIIPLSIAIGGFGTLLPIGIKSIMTAFRDKAGTASALHGCVTLGLTSIGSLLTIQMKNSFNVSSLESLHLFILPTVFILLFSALFTRKHLI